MEKRFGQQELLVGREIIKIGQKTALMFQGCNGKKWMFHSYWKTSIKMGQENLSKTSNKKGHGKYNKWVKNVVYFIIQNDL